MPSSNIIFFAPVLLIGAVTMYEDFKFSKIRNRWVKAGLVYTLSVYLSAIFLYTLCIHKGISPNISEGIFSLIASFDKWLINLMMSTLVAFMLWRFNMWGAGDAKLFIVYAALIPLGRYHRVYFNYYFASLSLLLNIFLPATVFLFLEKSIHFIKLSINCEIRYKTLQLAKEKLFRFDKIGALRILLGFFTFLFSFSILQRLLSNILNVISLNQTIVMIILILAFRPLSKIFKKNAKLIIIFLGFLLLYTLFNLVYLKIKLSSEIIITFLKAILIMLSFNIAYKTASFYNKRIDGETTPFAHWMFLGALITWFF